MKSTKTRCTLLTLALLAGACGGPPKPSPPASKPSSSPSPQATSAATTGGTGAAEALPAAAVAEAATIFQQRCATCHGALGKGDGAASAGLVPKPRDLTSSEWQASVTDTHVESIISYGGTAVGKAPTMPPNPDLANKPEVIKALRAHVRGLKNQ